MSAFPTAEDVIDGLHGVLVTVPGLAQLDPDGAICNVLKYEPKSIQSRPTLYSLLDSIQRETRGQVTTMRYRILHRLVFQWQENEESEKELLKFVNSVPAAIDRDSNLGGLVDLGMAKISDGSTGFVIISQTKYRCLDFFSDVLTKAAAKSGI